MKASEVLRLYKTGKRDFCRADLRGQSFKSQTLSGADFSEADLRGTNFTSAILKEVNFAGAKAGLQRHWAAGQLAILSMLSTLSGVLSGYTGVFTAYFLINPKYTIILGIPTLLFLLVLFVIVIRHGFVVETFGTLVIVISVAFIFVFSLAFTFNGIAAGAFALVTISAIFGIVTNAFVSVFSSSNFNKIFFSTANLFSLSTALTLVAKQMFVNLIPIAASLAIFFATAILLLGNYMASGVLQSDRKYLLIWKLSVAFNTIGGTCYWNADLTGTNFTQARLKSANFRKTTITHTYWKDAKQLHLARSGDTYLANPKIRQLVVTCNGQGQNFDGLDLTGVNLQGANLQDASFIGANLNQSNLRDADLSRAILKQVQLDEADLTGAILTGACIEDWGMTSTTKLENVQCDYVYMRLPTLEKRNPLRKPDDERKNFSEGEFADFIKPYFDTLDLYHRQDVDPRSISIALKNLAENHPDADLQFVALEWRGSGLNIRYTTASDVDKSELNHEYFTNYARIRKELLGSIQLRLAAQDAEINRMEGVINKFIQTGTHQSTIQAETIQVIQGEFAVTENRGININTGDNASISGLSSGDGIVNLGTISGNVTNAINQLPDSPEPAQANLKTLLAQLQQVIETDSDLPDPDKADLLEQVQSFAEAKQMEEPAKRESIARKAMKIFDATLKSLPDTAKIVDACSKLLPLILKALGFAA
ncbi:pentapeptide repeat-containing protein [Almyronema epifaneia]|uniref:Pentapeptide repeat-containing protein n=1 Tax=Almyronema epifaneia S1 TaxID=2991925 RepID=A0ABW6IN21_9CYAN